MWRKAERMLLFTLAPARSRSVDAALAMKAPRAIGITRSPWMISGRRRRRYPSMEM